MRLMFESLTITGLTAACLLVMTPAEAQHFRDFGAIEMDTADARAAGISGIHLQREGSEDVPAEWIVSGDALGLEGEMLGLFEIRYPNENREIVLFARADESATYRVTVDDSVNFFEFEQVGVENFTLSPLCDASKLDPGPRTGWTREELEELQAQIFECSKQIEITGTSMTLEEILQEYQPTFGLLASIASEVRRFFGIRTKKPRLSPQESSRELFSGRASHGATFAHRRPACGSS